MESPTGRAGRRRGRWLVLAALGLAVVALVIAIADLSTREPDPSKVELEGIGDAQQLFGGIRQAGDRLGPPDAELAIELFDDLQCASCREQFLATVPALVEDLVRPGEARMEYRHYSFSANPEQLGFFGAEAAADQGYGWQYIYLFFRNQAEAERVGLDEDYLRSVAGAIPELDLEQWQAYLDKEGGPDGEIHRTLAPYEELGRDLGIRAEPAAIVSGPNGTRLLQDSPRLVQIQHAVAAVR
jgi:protein-disulfide isomerase